MVTSLNDGMGRPFLKELAFFLYNYNYFALDEIDPGFHRED